MITANNAHMDDIALFIFKESQIANARFVHKIHNITEFHLLGGIAGQAYVDAVVHILHESGAVNASGGTAAPKVWGVEVMEGEIKQKVLLLA